MLNLSFLSSLSPSVQLPSPATFSWFPTSIPQPPSNPPFPLTAPVPGWKVRRGAPTTSPPPPECPSLPKSPHFPSLPPSQSLFSFSEHWAVISSPLWAILSLSFLWYSPLSPTKYFWILSSGLAFTLVWGRNLGAQLTPNPSPLSKGRKAHNTLLFLTILLSDSIHMSLLFANCIFCSLKLIHIHVAEILGLLERGRHKLAPNTYQYWPSCPLLPPTLFPPP